MDIEFLPEQFDLRLLAERRAKLSGSLDLAKMKRLAPLILENSGNVLINLEFGVNDQGLCYVATGIKAELSLLCQRCLSPMRHNIVTNTILSPVAGESEGEQLPEPFEPVLDPSGQIILSDMIEDEILLSLPIVAKHEIEKCPAACRGAFSL